jgi:hypothetical protein
MAVNNATGALNARGDLLASRLQDIPMRAEEIALHGVCHGAVVALTIAQVRSRLELRWHQPSFASYDDHHDLVVDFEGLADAVANTSSAKGIVNNVFFGP